MYLPKRTTRPGVPMHDSLQCTSPKWGCMLPGCTSRLTTKASPKKTKLPVQGVARRTQSEAGHCGAGASASPLALWPLLAPSLVLILPGVAAGACAEVPRLGLAKDGAAILRRFAVSPPRACARAPASSPRPCDLYIRLYNTHPIENAEHAVTCYRWNRQP